VSRTEPPVARAHPVPPRQHRAGLTCYAAVQRVIERPDRPEYIVLEASGVAEPSGIVSTFADPGLRDRFRLDSTLCVMDAAGIFAAPELMDVKLRQIAYSDMLILNKTGLVAREEIGRIKDWLDEHFYRYRLVEATRGNVPLEILLAEGRFDPARPGAAGHQCADGHPVTTIMGLPSAPGATRPTSHSRSKPCGKGLKSFQRASIAAKV
jgi:G3E family GTPase